MRLSTGKGSHWKHGKAESLVISLHFTNVQIEGLVGSEKRDCSVTNINEILQSK